MGGAAASLSRSVLGPADQKRKECSRPALCGIWGNQAGEHKQSGALASFAVAADLGPSPSGNPAPAHVAPDAAT